MDTFALKEKIKDLDANGLKTLLKEVKLYQELSGKLGKRGRELFERKHSGEKLLVVEYFTALNEDLAWQQAQSVFKKAFDLDVQREKVLFVQDERLQWGIKVYMDDSMVDLSFSKIERFIRK